MTADDRQRDTLRTSGADRQRAAEVLATALREGRLDAREYDRRSRSAEHAKSVAELKQLLTDLPRQLGVREWADHLRIRQADREQVIRWLTDAQTEGRMTGEEHGRRLTGLTSAGTYADLRAVLDGVPGPPDASRDDLLVSDADRQAVLNRLAAARADGLIGESEHRDKQATVRRAKRYRELDRAAVNLNKRASPADRTRAVRRLGQAQAAGQLDAAEHARRVDAANGATRNSELAALLADLTPTAGSRGTARSLLALNRRHRLTDAEREQAAQELQYALDDGRLTLDEYDERVREAYATQTVAQLHPLLSDLVALEGQRPADPAAGKRRPWWTPVTAVAVAVAVAVGVGVGIAAHRAGGDDRDSHAGAVEHPRLGVLWSAPYDRPSDAKGMGSWVTDQAVIRARTDRVVAYLVADGRVAWSFPIPADHELCTMSRATSEDIGLIGYGPAESYRCTTIVALDLTTGRPLWERQRPADGIDYWHSDEVALATDVAVIRETTGFLAVDARAGKQRWRLPLAKGCRAYSVAADSDAVALLTACADRAAQLAIVNAAAGRERWHAPLRLSPQDDSDHSFSGEKSTVVLSVDPLVVRTSDQGGAFIAFDDHGKRRTTIPQSGPDLDVAAGAFPTSFTGRPAYPVAVLGDVLVATARKPGDSHDTAVAGFSLTDGHRLWLADAGWISALGVAAGDVLTVDTAALSGGRLLLFAAQRGGVRRLVEVSGDLAAALQGVTEVSDAGGRYVLISAAGGTSAPVTVIGPR